MPMGTFGRMSGGSEWKSIRTRDTDSASEGTPAWWRGFSINSLLRRPCFPCAVQGRIDAGAHGGKLISHADEASNLWQNLFRTVYESLETDAHCWNSQAGAPISGVAFLLPVSLADIDSLLAL